jgi:sugar lactone lactonase YvrE
MPQALLHWSTPDATKVTARAVVLSAALLAIAPPSSSAQAVDLPPDVVSTVFVTDTIPDYGAVGGVATDALGFVYIADFRNAVFRLAPDGTLTKFADGFYGASGNTTGPQGHLFQSSFYGNYLSRISRDGVVETWVDTGLNGPVGIAAASDGTLFVVNCTGGSVSRISPDRTVSEFARDPRMACPNGITMDDRGDLYVVSFNSTKVLRITPDGAVSEFADVPGAGGNGHIAFSRGGFYVTKNRANQVYRVARDGSVRLLAGSGAAGGADGPALEATFALPNGVAVSPTGDEVWVNELRSGQGLGRGVSVVALRRIRLVSLTDVLTAVDPSLGVPGIEAGYVAYHDAHPGEETSAGTIALGYQWLTAGRIAEGVALFGLNAVRFANDANAQFHYGEAFRYTGSSARAAEQYRKVLALDPAHANAAARLAEVSERG